jgi:VanZ family protein
MVAVWFLSDGLSLQTPELLSDKVLHFAAYGLFGLLNLRAFHGGFRRPVWWASLAALLLTVGFGALDEWRQTGVSFRDASWQDWLADLAGGVVAWLGLRLIRFDAHRPKTTRPSKGC